MKKPSTIEAKFLRSRVLSEFTRLWKDIDIEAQTGILSTLNLLPGEEVILGYLPDHEYWWLITNSRLILKEHDFLSYNLLTNIEKVKLDEVFENERSKQDSVSIELITKDGMIKLRVEERLWPVVYDLFRFIIKK